MRARLFHTALLLGIVTGCGDRSSPVAVRGPFDVLTPAAAVSVAFPADNPGPPYYSMQERDFFPHTDEWVGIVFLRETACIPSNFNLLDQLDPPAAFGCPLVVEGRATFKNGLPPIDLAPIHVTFSGLGAVPIWFVSWPALQAAVADGTLTIAELAAMPSLRIGIASKFDANQHPGPERPQGFGNGKIEIEARGALVGGGTFSFQVREMGIEGVSTLRHVAIDISK
jgi:hypothetical protein